MENKSYCYILDFNTCSIYEIEVSENEIDLSVEDLLKLYGLKSDTCDYMFSTNRLNIETIDKLNNE